MSKLENSFYTFLVYHMSEFVWEDIQCKLKHTIN